MMSAVLWLCASGSLAAQTFTTVFSFDGADGSFPLGLVQATDGNLYGTTQASDGTIFKIAPSGTLTTLYSFAEGSGVTPAAGLIQGTDGNFYGTNSSGGVNEGNCQYDCGTVFKITPAGTFTTLHSFEATDGDGPAGALVQATDGNFYGTTLGGGANGDGTVFQMTPSGTLATLHSFDNTDGRNPNALIQDTSGTLYGTTARGASTIRKYHRCTGVCGKVFSVSVGLSRFVEAQPGSGKVGAAIKILGTDLTGSTSVSFNGTAAKFTVVSSSEITTSVPADASTGEVEVVTPSATLSTNVPFRVP
ncbi:MAG: choice-of-anchor tandem repeat GloVer-containing protein [Terriglobales bacterium]